MLNQSIYDVCSNIISTRLTLFHFGLQLIPSLTKGFIKEITYNTPIFWLLTKIWENKVFLCLLNFLPNLKKCEVLTNFEKCIIRKIRKNVKKFLHAYSIFGQNLKKRRKDLSALFFFSKLWQLIKEHGLTPSFGQKFKS